MKIINLKYALLLMLILVSCKHNPPEKKFLPGLPVAENSNKILSSDSCFFSVSVKEDSIMLADNDTSCFIKDFIEIGDFVCKRIKSGKITINSDYPIILYIDSMTPYPVVDRLIEELQLLGFNAFYFKTRENGFYCAFFESTNDDGTRAEIGKLYGNRFLVTRDLIKACGNNDYWIKYIKPQADKPPPPPPPPPPDLFMDDKLFMIRKYSSATVSMENGRYLMDSIKLSKVNFGLGISKYYILFIKMNKENTYSDFISILNIISAVNNLQLNHYSIKEFGKSFFELSKEKQIDIKRSSKSLLHFVVLSFSYQNYIEQHKNLYKKVKYTAPKINKKNK